MPSVDSFTLSARVPNRTADEFKKLADSLGLTPNALIKDMVERAVTGDAQTVRPESKTKVKQVDLPETSKRLYGVALTLVDDLEDAGYPVSEIERAFSALRKEML